MALIGIFTLIETFICLVNTMFIIFVYQVNMLKVCILFLEIFVAPSLNTTNYTCKNAKTSAVG